MIKKIFNKENAKIALLVIIVYLVINVIATHWFSLAHDNYKYNQDFYYKECLTECSNYGLSIDYINQCKLWCIKEYK